MLYVDCVGGDPGSVDKHAGNILRTCSCHECGRQKILKHEDISHAPDF